MEAGLRPDPDDEGVIWLSNSREVLDQLADPLRKGESWGRRLAEATLLSLRSAAGLPPRAPTRTSSFPALPAEEEIREDTPHDHDDEDSEGDQEEATDSPGRPPGEESITMSQQAELRKLHVNLGHPPRAEFCGP